LCACASDDEKQQCCPVRCSGMHVSCGLITTCSILSICEQGLAPGWHYWNKHGCVTTDGPGPGAYSVPPVGMPGYLCKPTCLRKQFGIHGAVVGVASMPCIQLHASGATKCLEASDMLCNFEWAYPMLDSVDRGCFGERREQLYYSFFT
jgi:hypothetical protein